MASLREKGGDRSGRNNQFMPQRVKVLHRTGYPGPGIELSEVLPFLKYFNGDTLLA